APAAKRPGGRSVHNAHCPVVAVQSRSAGCNRDTCFFAMTTLFNCSIKQFYAMAADSNRDAGSFALFRHAAAPAPARGNLLDEQAWIS
ncbi:hypothetical protein, partial [uncultured Desulfovibrio sp.]|uniref:hypothetical protein n=1 Tax=uncultured Desulfovibrio sp. TaxID=167968 RepID=UPI00262EFEDF